LSALKLGVIGSSRKKDGRRYPIHPEHIVRIAENVRKNLFLRRAMVSALVSVTRKLDT